MAIDFRAVEHRPWALPRRPWVMAMRWEHLLFMHWPVDAVALQRALPAGVELQTFDGRAWLGVVPFIMAGVRPRGTPAVPWFSRFCELNVRTYVTVGGRPGVYFFSLDCGNPVATETARAVWSLPYFRSRMCAHLGDSAWVHYISTRYDRRAPRAAFAARYQPTGPPAPAEPNTLAHFLTERYALYVTDRHGRVRRGDIHHVPWPLQPAECHTAALDMTRLIDLPLPADPPLLHYARRLDVAAWLPVEA